MSDALTQESTAKVKEISAKTGLQYRTLLYLVPLNVLPGRQVPLREPSDDGKVGREIGYPALPLIRAGRAVPTNLIGFSLLKNRRTVAETLTTLADHRLVVSKASGGVGGGLLWKPTKAGKEVFQELLTTYNNDGRCFTGYDIHGFDADNFDRLGIDYFGVNRAGEDVGVHHIFTHYYGKTYFG